MKLILDLYFVMIQIQNDKFILQSICYDIGRFLPGVQPSILLAQ